MKLSELEGAQLDFWVAKLEGHRPRINARNICQIQISREGVMTEPWDVGEGDNPKFGWIDYSPRQHWSTGGPLIEKYGLMLMKIQYEEGYLLDTPYWNAHWTNGHDSVHYRHKMSGPTPLIAAMRALVSSKFGTD